MNYYDYEKGMTAFGAYGGTGIKAKKTKKKPGALGPIRCRDCGRTDVTLVKCSDGHYICMNCIEKRR